MRDVSFDLHRGEILGLGGLVGAGRSETVETIFGLRPRAGGEVLLKAQPFAPRTPARGDPRRASASSPRTVAGSRIVPDLSVRENLLLGHLGAHRGFGLGYGKREQKIDELMARLELPRAPARRAKPARTSPAACSRRSSSRAGCCWSRKVLILDEPTKGVDIGTRASIYAILRDIAATGAAIVIVSSEFEELLGLADRVIVISDGRFDRRRAERLSRRGEADAARRAAQLRWSATGACLQELANQCDGAAFWAILDDERVFCLNAATANAKG